MHDAKVIPDSNPVWRCSYLQWLQNFRIAAFKRPCIKMLKCERISPAILKSCSSRMGLFYDTQASLPPSQCHGILAQKPAVMAGVSAVDILRLEAKSAVLRRFEPFNTQ
jgi:hypothetical protein